jgi:hypothetical protein
MRSSPETRNIGLHGICVLPDRLRRLDPEKVDELAEAMKLEGQISPIGVRRRGGPEGTGFILIYGRHRYEAAVRLKWQAIRCEIWEGLEAVQAELMEIDENLIRANLSPAEEALHYGRRKELYEQLHPETKPGGAPGAGKGKGKKKRLEGSQNENFVRRLHRRLARGAARLPAMSPVPTTSSCCPRSSAPASIGEASWMRLVNCRPRTSVISQTGLGRARR